MSDRKTIFDLQSIIEKCFEDCKKMGYLLEYRGADGERLLVVNQTDLINHIRLTVIGELYELEIIRRIAPIFREHRALTTDFMLFGEAFQEFYDKEIQARQMKGLRIREGE